MRKDPLFFLGAPPLDYGSVDLPSFIVYWGINKSESLYSVVVLARLLAQKQNEAPRDPPLLS